MVEGVSEDTIDWTRFTENVILSPPYPPPFDSSSINDAMKDILGTHNMFIAYIMLDFYTMPMWPTTQDQWHTPFEGLFYYCVHCNAPCNSGSQICMEFFLPAESDATTRGIDTDMATWSWVPRIKCHMCVSESTNLNMRTLTYFPCANFLDDVIGSQITKILNTVAENKVNTTTTCCMCDKPMHGKKKKKKNSFCSSTCKEYHTFMQTIDCVPARGTTGLLQLMELFSLFKRNGMDINGAMCWNSVCNRYKVPLSPCRSRGNKHLRCGECHRVVYCSKRCKKLDMRPNGHKCHTAWNNMFTTQLTILQE